MQISGAADLIATTATPELSLFTALEELPFTTFTSVLSMILIAFFFISGADAAAIVMGMLASRGVLEPARAVTAVMGVLMGAIASALLLVGGLGALQQGAVLASVPFTFVIVGLTYCLDQGDTRGAGAAGRAAAGDAAGAPAPAPPAPGRGVSGMPGPASRCSSPARSPPAPAARRSRNRGGRPSHRARSCGSRSGRRTSPRRASSASCGARRSRSTATRSTCASGSARPRTSTGRCATATSTATSPTPVPCCRSSRARRSRAWIRRRRSTR